MSTEVRLKLSATVNGYAIPQTVSAHVIGDIGSVVKGRYSICFLDDAMRAQKLVQKRLQRCLIISLK